MYEISVEAKNVNPLRDFEMQIQQALRSLRESGSNPGILESLLTKYRSKETEFEVVRGGVIGATVMIKERFNSKTEVPYTMIATEKGKYLVFRNYKPEAYNGQNEENDAIFSFEDPSVIAFYNEKIRSMKKLSLYRILRIFGFKGWKSRVRQ